MGLIKGSGRMSFAEIVVLTHGVEIVNMLNEENASLFSGHGHRLHEAFMLGTSKAKYDDKSFDIFITTTPVSDLREDVVQEIEEVDTDEHYRPKSTIGIKDISLKQEI
ncbi:unnamed protein product [Spirodela intermedia]|uniref:Uncharacterized protein n=1 Tax=Spirodela intermedia TaxID=51605 RepID=A0A7I8KWK8_SPIIN|nr:unnamed protein product [Spirodela intermedia]